jgi:hypothetical protein
MSYIGIKPAESFTSFATQTFSTSATSSYTLDHAVTNENELALFINNVRQQPGSGKAYTATGTALTLSANTASTDTMYAVFLGRALQTVNPADASVGASQVADNLISGKTALAATPADTDELLISDAGTLKRIDFSHIKSSPGLVHIKTVTASDSSSIDFSNGSSDVVLDSTYNKYCFMIDIHIGTDNTTLQYLYSTDAGSSYLSSNYVYAGQGIVAGGGGEVTRQSSSDSQMEINNATIGGDADESLSATLFLSMPSRTDTHKLSYWNGAFMDTSANTTSFEMAGTNNGSTAAVTGVRFKMSSGNIEYGTISMFGVANS